MEHIMRLYKRNKINNQHIMVNLLLILGIIFATLGDGFTSTALSFCKSYMLGDLYTTSDEFALLDVSYTVAKLSGFILVPALFARFNPLRVLQVAVIILAIFSVLMVTTSILYALIFARVIQGLAGGIVFVSGQTLLFNRFNIQIQPIIQLFFALSAVVFPATFVYFFEGWMVDNFSWKSIFITVPILEVLALFFLSLLPNNIMISSGKKSGDILGLLLFIVSAICLTYIAQEGSRWNWFESTHIIFMTLCGFMALLIAIVRWILLSHTHKSAIVDLSVFNNLPFCFGFITSFVAGIALFGSASLISGFVLNIIGMTITGAGVLIATGGTMFIVSLLLTAYLIKCVHMHPLATIPLGIGFIMLGMWLLSSSTSESGYSELIMPLLIRGSGLGFLFLSLTIYALSTLKGSQITQGVAFFTILRQLGGLLGIATFQRYLAHQNSLNLSILSSHLNMGNNLLSERLNTLQTMLQNKGVAAEDSIKMAIGLLNKSMTLQSNVISYNEAFFAILMIFIIAAPFLLSSGILLRKFHPAKTKKDAV